MIRSSVHVLADTMLTAGEARRAAPLLDEATGLWETIGNRWGMAWALHGQGRVLRAEGVADAARDRLAASLAQRREIGDRRGEAESLEALASLDAELRRSPSDPCIARGAP